MAYSLSELQARYGKLTRNVTRGTEVKVKSGERVDTYIVETPDALAAQAGVDKAIYSLARVINSEGYSGLDKHRAAAAVATGQAILNETAQSGTNITSKLTNSTLGEPFDNRYGSQRGRYASTVNDPTEWDIEVARSILTSHVPDLVKGANQFSDLLVHDDRVQAGSEIKSAAGIIQQRIGEGKEWIGPVPGVDSYALMFFRKQPDAAKRAKSLQKALAVAEAGPARVCLVEGRKKVCTPETRMVLAGMAPGVAGVIGLLGMVGLGFFIKKKHPNWFRFFDNV